MLCTRESITSTEIPVIDDLFSSARMIWNDRLDLVILPNAILLCALMIVSVTDTGKKLLRRTAARCSVLAAAFEADRCRVVIKIVVRVGEGELVHSPRSLGCSSLQNGCTREGRFAYAWA